MNLQSATIQAFVNVLIAANLTTIPAGQVYADQENTENNVVSDAPLPDKRKLPCVIVSSDAPRELVAFTGQYMSRVSVAVHCNADDYTGDQFDAMQEEVSNVFVDQTVAQGTPIDRNYLPQLLSAALDNFTSQYARLISQDSDVKDRRWIATFDVDVCSAQADG